MAGATAPAERRFLKTLHETAVREPISWRGMLVLSAFWFAIAYVMQPLGSTIIPVLVGDFITHPTALQVGPAMLHLDINTYVAILDTFGAVFAIVWQPAIGALSDNHTAGIGRRRPLFCTLAGTALYPQQVRTTLTRLAARAGIDKRVHPHGLRHAHAAHLNRAGVPITTIVRQLGHANLADTSRYLQSLGQDEHLARVQTINWQSP